MYFTAAVSVFLVLFLIGAECVLLFSALSVADRFRENAVITLVLDDSRDSLAVQRADSALHAMPYFTEIRFTSKQQALEEHIARLGENPVDLLGYNPLFDSYDLHPKAAYATPDALDNVVARLRSLPYTDQVIYQRDMADLVEHNIHNVSIVLLIIAGVLLLISMVLIINTVRLQIYSKRFLINTMTLVGATAHHIRMPFVWRNLLMGFVAGVMALAAIAGVMYYLTTEWGVILFDYTPVPVAIISGVVLGTGLLLTLLATLIATSRYIRMNADTMYEI